MRPGTIVSCIAIAMLAGACGEQASNVAGTGTFVSPSEVTLGLGKHQRFQFDLPAKSVAWSISGGPDVGYVSQSGMYYAPLRPPALPTVRVVATVGSLSIAGTVRLTAAPVDSLDCLAEGQAGDKFGDYIYVEELPEAVVKVNPTYPDSAREAGVDGLVMVQARVCACGEVDSTRIVKSIPMLDAAATAAVRQWLFKPGTSNGEPVAVWVGVPVRFSLH